MLYANECRFDVLCLQLMGFVASDVSEKISVLRRYRDTSGETFTRFCSSNKPENAPFLP